MKYFQVFSGNRDRNTVVEHLLVTAFNARFIRFHPKSWKGHICMRAEVYGCRNGTLVTEPNEIMKEIMRYCAQFISALTPLELS